MASTKQHVSLLARSFSTAQLAKQLSSHIVARARLKSDTLSLGRNDEVSRCRRAAAWRRGAHVHREMRLNMIDKFWNSGRKWIGVICPLLAFRAMVRNCFLKIALG